MTYKQQKKFLKGPKFQAYSVASTRKRLATG